MTSPTRDDTQPGMNDGNAGVNEPQNTSPQAREIGPYPFTREEALAELQRRYPRAFDGSDPIDRSDGLRVENARDWVLAFVLSALPEGGRTPVAWRYAHQNTPNDWRLADHDIGQQWPNLICEPLYALPSPPSHTGGVLGSFSQAKIPTEGQSDAGGSS